MRLSKDLSNEQAGPFNYLGKESPGRRNSKCKGLEAGMELPLRQQQGGQCREWRVKEWREGDVVGYKGRSYEQGWESSKQKQGRL